MGRETRFFAGAWMTDFQILETLALEQGVARHLDRHLARMAASSAHFGYPWDEARVRACLADLAAGHASGEDLPLLEEDHRLDAQNVGRAAGHLADTAALDEVTEVADREEDLVGGALSAQPIHGFVQ